MSFSFLISHDHLPVSCRHRPILLLMTGFTRASSGFTQTMVEILANHRPVFSRFLGKTLDIAGEKHADSQIHTDPVHILQTLVEYHVEIVVIRVNHGVSFVKVGEGFLELDQNITEVE
jgi:hypothetical protein